LSSNFKKRRFISHGGDIWGFSRKYKIPLEDVLEFSGPINFLGPSPKALEAVKKYAHLIRYYPDPNPLELKIEIAKYVGQGIDEGNVILGNGSIELIYMITEILQKGFKALIPVPSFAEYEKATLRVGGEAMFIQLSQNFFLEPDKIKSAVTDETKIICLCNPHSPSGTLYTKEILLDIVSFCHKKDIIFSIDENYIEFAEDGQNNTLAGFVKEYENLFVIRSVTKFYGMPGIRFGYGIASQTLIDKLETVRQPWSINGLAGVATLAAIDDSEFIEKTKKTIAKERVEFARALERIEGLHVFPSVTNFLLVKIQNRKITSTMLKDLLAKEQMLIRDCCTFVGLDDNYFRVTVRSARDNQKIVEKIREIFNSHHELSVQNNNESIS
jgi:threonine-phosphate decarboxylase